MSDTINTSSIAERNLKVVELQGRGEMQEALTAALETEQLAVAHLPGNDVERAKSIYNLGAIQTALGDFGGFETLIRALEAMKASVGEQHQYYGRLLSLIAYRLEMFGRFEMAERYHVKAICNFYSGGTDTGSYLDEEVRSIARLHAYLSQKEPAAATAATPDDSQVGEAHFERSLQTRAMRAELDQLPPDIRKIAESNLDKAREVFGAHSTHQVAQAIIKDRETRGEPFALLLRGFEGEAYDYVIHLGPKLSGWPGLGELIQYANDPESITGDPDRKMVVTPTEGPGKLEVMLANALKDHLRPITVASPSSIDPGQTIQGGLVPRIILADATWLRVVRSYIRLAHLIVVDGLGLNPGVRLELEAIVQSGKCDNTVIVLHRDRARFEELENTALISADIAGGTLDLNVERVWLTKDNPILRPFTRIGYVEDLSSETLASDPLFHDLLAMTPLARTSTRLGMAGTKLIESDKAQDGVLYLQAAMLTARGLTGWAERATVCFNLGIMYGAAGQLESALDAFNGSHTVALATNDLSDQGRALAMIGDVYLKMNKPAEARAALVKCLTPLDATKDEYLDLALRKLAEACRGVHDEAQASICEVELQRLQAEKSGSLKEAAAAFHKAFLS
jgi:tetratricopeptide (TPR) repeat protein